MMKKVWRAYVNDGVELSWGDGCRTKKEAIQLCRDDRAAVMEESEDGTDLGLEYYIEQEVVTDNAVTVIKAMNIIFKK